MWGRFSFGIRAVNLNTWQAAIYLNAAGLINRAVHECIKHRDSCKGAEKKHLAEVRSLGSKRVDGRQGNDHSRSVRDWSLTGQGIAQRARLVKKDVPPAAPHLDRAASGHRLIVGEARPAGACPGTQYQRDNTRLNQVSAHGSSLMMVAAQS
jgi:hypothetical protein